MHKGLQYQIDEYYLYLQKQGQGMELISGNETRRNPFPGLRPFRTSEAHLFFGREGQSEELIERLMRTRFLAVLGNSGSGKSSLVRAGLIPALHAGRKQRKVSDWKIVICRPGNSPLQNLAAALAGAKLNDTKPEAVEPEVRRFLPILQDSSFGLLEAEEEVEIHGKTLLIVDQFEELFRFGKEIPPGDAAHFVDLLLNAVGQEGAHIYVVITMRSEFLGECVRYRGLPEIINSGQYLVPRLTGENVRRAVTGPLAVVHAPVDAAFANRLVREVGDNMDQLPLLQHALMRSYNKWQDEDGTSPIGHAEYDAAGGMQQAMGYHADELYAALDEKGREIARLIFQRLTDLGAGNQGGRRPTLMAEIYGLCEAVSATRVEVDAVIERFRDTGASFLMPPPGVALQDGNMLDISHESLIRNWARLGEWAAKETEAARLYERLEQGYLEAHENNAGLPPIVLQRLDEWLGKSRINAFWAARYHPGIEPAHDWGQHRERFERNLHFFEEAKRMEEASRLARDNEIAKKAREKQRTRYRRIIVTIAVSAAIAGFSLAVFAWNQSLLANAALLKTQSAREKVVRLTLTDVDRLVYQLEYEEAYAQVRGTQSIGVSKDLVSDALLEFAFWYGETGELPRAWGILDTAYALSGRRLIAQGPKDLAGLRTALRDLDGQRDSFLQARYFPEMVAVRGGEFTMGSEEEDDEKPPHRVVVADFQMGATEVTWWQYGLYAAAERGNGVKMPEVPAWGIRGDNPVVYVMWYDAVRYANWLSKRRGLVGVYKHIVSDAVNDNVEWPDPRCPGYRLPTEAEWEYAARGGKQQEWAGTDSEDTLEDYAWYAANRGSRTRPVRGKKANAFGLYGMSGNVWEWCWDWYGEYGVEPKNDPVGPSEGTYRVLHGGGWSNPAVYCRSASRIGRKPAVLIPDIGFRLVFVP